MKPAAREKAAAKTKVLLNAMPLQVPFLISGTGALFLESFLTFS